MSFKKTIARELKIRAQKLKVLEHLQDYQSALLCDSRFNVFYSSRRQGKTYTLCALLIYMCLSRRNVRCIYIAQFATVAKRNVVDEIIVPLLKFLKISYKYNRNLGLFTFENNSRLELAGADNPALAELFRGSKNLAIGLDEAQSYRSINLYDFINIIIKPTLTDLEGSLYITGTPNDNFSSYFYELCHGVHKEFKIHAIPPLANKFTKAQQEQELNNMEESSPGITSEPWVRREYYGEWVKDTRKNIFKFNVKKNNISYPYNYHVVSIDWGYNDPTAIVVAGIHHEIHLIDSFEQTQMDFDKILGKILELKGLYPHAFWVADPGGTSKVLTNELSRQANVVIEVAQKTEKKAHVELLAQEIEMYKVFIDDDKLLKSLEVLQWQDGREGRELPVKDDHLLDATLYAWRKAKDYLTIQNHNVLEPYEVKMRKQIINKMKKQKDNRWI